MNGIELEQDAQGATVLPFAGQLRRRRPLREETGARGEILFFTGVRYERHGPASDPATPARRGSASLRDPRRSA
jgi:hypothetical protein